jgi:hypothetical protein
MLMRATCSAHLTLLDSIILMFGEKYIISCDVYTKSVLSQSCNVTGLCNESGGNVFRVSTPSPQNSYVKRWAQVLSGKTAARMTPGNYKSWDRILFRLSGEKIRGNIKRKKNSDEKYNWILSRKRITMKVNTVAGVTQNKNACVSQDNKRNTSRKKMSIRLFIPVFSAVLSFIICEMDGKLLC